MSDSNTPDGACGMKVGIFTYLRLLLMSKNDRRDTLDLLMSLDRQRRNAGERWLGVKYDERALLLGGYF
jgi:hypothetical protein